MTIWVKICGLSTSESVSAAVAAGVQAVGFVFAESVRQISPEQALQLASEIPATIKTVAVFLRPGQSQIDRVLDVFTPDMVQADWQSLSELHLPDSVQTLPVYREGQLGKQNSLPGRFLFEGAKSGQGQTVDWPAASNLSRLHELVLAGGLTPENIGQAIREVKPFGVDVSSGVESQRGAKDILLMQQFVHQVRLAETCYLPDEDTTISADKSL